MALLSNFLMSRQPDMTGGGGMATNLMKDGGAEGGGGRDGGDQTPPPTVPAGEPEAPPEGPIGQPLPELPGGGPTEPQPTLPPTTTTPMGPGSLQLPGGASTAPLRTADFGSNRFVGGPLEMMKNRRQGAGMPGQPGSLEGGVPTAPMMPSEDMLARIVDRVRRRNVPQTVR